MGPMSQRGAKDEGNALASRHSFFPARNCPELHCKEGEGRGWDGEGLARVSYIAEANLKIYRGWTTPGRD